MVIFELFEEDIIRKETYDEYDAYFFDYVDNRNFIYKMYDQENNGERPDDFDSFTESEREVVFLMPEDTPINWPIVIELLEEEDYNDEEFYN